VAAIVALLSGAQLVTCAGSSATRCDVADECWAAPEGAELGRCDPKEVACLQGSCRLACAQPCEVVDPSVNPCRDAKQICNQSKSRKVAEPFCASSAIACDSVDDCPLSLPSGSIGDAWSCDSNVCRFPGFEYAWR
jgi:hypothetical protein